MDLKQFKIENESVFLPLRHPGTNAILTTDEGEEIGVFVVGIDSDIYQKIDREISNKRLTRLRKNRGLSEITAEQIEKEEIEKFASCVVGLKHIVFDGETLSHSQQNVLKLFSELPWAKRQICEFIGESSNFFEKLEPNS